MILSQSERHRQTMVRLTVIGIVMLAFSLRMWGLNFGLPSLYHPDEPNYVIGTQLLFKNFDLNLGSYPVISSSKFVYVINAIAYVPYYAAGALAGLFRTPADITFPVVPTLGVGSTSMPTTFILGRFVSVMFGTASVVLTYFSGRQLMRKAAVGLVAAAMLAVSPTAVYHSRLITPDVFVVFFALLGFLGAVLLSRDNRRRYYVLSGIAIGGIAATKVSGILIVIPILIAHFQLNGFKGLRIPNLYLMIVVSGLAYALGTPYLLVNPVGVVQDILYEGRHYSSGHAGMEGDTLAWYVRYLAEYESLPILFGVIEIARGFVLRSKTSLLLASFPLVLFVFASTFVVRNDRTILPALPFVFILAACLLSSVLAWLRPRFRAAATIATAIVAVVVAVSMPMARTLQANARLTAIDSRETATDWIRDNLAKGTRIAFEAYSPFIDNKQYATLPMGRIIDHDPGWYVENQIEFAICSAGMFGRYVSDPRQYPVDAGRYQAFFNSFELVRSFNDGGFEIRIYRIVR